MKEYVIPTDVLGNEFTAPTCDELYKERVKKSLKRFLRTAISVHTFLRLRLVIRLSRYEQRWTRMLFQ